jgi:hypothetical protein
VVLPMLLARLDPAARGLVAWPRGWVFAGLLAGVSVLAVYRFGQEFAHTRALYGIAASVHAWIEVPLIVIALTRTAQPGSSNPTATEAALSTAEVSTALGGDSSAAQAITHASARTTIDSATTTVGP